MDASKSRSTSCVPDQLKSQNDDCILPEDLKRTTSFSSDLIQDNLNYPNKIKIFLKIRSLSINQESVVEEEDEVFTVMNPTNLLTKIPSADGTTFSRPLKHPNSVESQPLRKYKFTKILTPEVPQTQLFEEVAKQNVLEFIEGQSSTLTNFGTSNSGKTFSLFGTTNYLGIIPSSIKLLFSTIEFTSEPFFKLGYGNIVINLSEADKILNTEAKEKLFTCRTIDKSENLDSSLEFGDFPLKKEDDFIYSIWLSFVEIYNENIFDLLAVSEEGKNMQLKLVTDKKGNNYLNGVRRVFVVNSEEAFQVMLAGKSKLKIASTATNSKSSRSHAIFAMTLLKHSKNSAPEDATVSTLTFCDLAGSGGLRNVKNLERSKESRSINASLLVLGRCLKTVQENLISRNNPGVTGPFRESNLTRYLQGALLGRENLIILVHLNKSPELYVETQNVLNFVSIVNKMTSESSKNTRRMMFSRGISQNSTGINSPNISACPTPALTPELKNNYERLKEANDKLLKELSSLRCCALDKEYEIRQELSDLYSTRIKNLEKDWRKKNEELDEEREDLLKWSVKQVEDFYKERINNITYRKRKRLSNQEGNGDCEQSTIQSLEAENAEATSKILALRKIIDNLKKINIELSVQKSDLAFELSMTKKELNDLKTSKYQDESTFEPEENTVSKRRETFLFQFTGERDSVNQLQKQLKDKDGIIEELESQLEEKDLEIFELKEKLQKTESGILENTTEDEVIVNKESEMISKSIAEPEDFNSKLKVLSNVSSPNSIYKISFTEEENSLIEDSRSPRVSLRTLVKVPALEPLDLQEDNRLSFLDSSVEKSEKSIRRSSEGSSENDSGIRTSSGSGETSDFNKTENEDKYVQVDFEFEEDIGEIRSKLESLRHEYKILSDNYSNKSSKVEELVLEIEKFKNSISQLEAHSFDNNRKLEEYQELLASKDKELKNLNLKKQQLEIEYNDSFKVWREKMEAYENKFEKLEKPESVMNNLEKSIVRCVNLGHQITIDQAQLQEKVLKCSTEHVSRITKLEQELIEKNLIVSNLYEKVSEAKIGLSRLEQLDDKIKNFETVLNKNQKEKEDLQKQLQERTTHQRNLESQLTSLSEKITERDSELMSLQETFNHTKIASSVNYKNSNELSKMISESLLKMGDIKSELIRTEEARNSLDRTWAQEYGFLRSQLTFFENQGSLMSIMYEKNEDMLTEMEKLKRDLDTKDKQIQEMKNNRDETIRRYDSLVDQLQMDVDVIKQNKEYLASQESAKPLRKSISETFKFKKGKSKAEDKGNVNPKANSKFWSSQTVNSSDSMESIPHVPGQPCQCSKVQTKKDHYQIEGESVLNIISTKLYDFYNNIDAKAGTTLIKIVDNRKSVEGNLVEETE